MARRCACGVGPGEGLGRGRGKQFSRCASLHSGLRQQGRGLKRAVFGTTEVVPLRFVRSQGYAGLRQRGSVCDPGLWCPVRCDQDGLGENFWGEP